MFIEQLKNFLNFSGVFLLFEFQICLNCKEFIDNEYNFPDSNCPQRNVGLIEKKFKFRNDKKSQIRKPPILKKENLYLNAAEEVSSPKFLIIAIFILIVFEKFFDF